MEDEQILDLFFERSEQAIGALSEKYGGKLEQIAFRIVRRREDAEECVSESYWRLWNSIPPKRPRPLFAYAAKTVRNLAIGCLRHSGAQKRGGEFELTIDELAECLADPAGLDEALDARELGRLLDSFLAGLDRESRVLFLRRYWFGESVAEIAAAFGMKPGTVSVRLFRTREQLKSYLTKEGIAV